MNILTRNVPRQYLRNGNLNLTGEGYSSFSYGLSGMTGGYLPALPLEEGGYLVEDIVTFSSQVIMNKIKSEHLYIEGDTDIFGDLNITGEFTINGKPFEGGEGGEGGGSFTYINYDWLNNESTPELIVEVDMSEGNYAEGQVKAFEDTLYCNYCFRIDKLNRHIICYGDGTDITKYGWATWEPDKVKIYIHLNQKACTVGAYFTTFELGENKAGKNRVLSLDVENEGWGVNDENRTEYSIGGLHLFGAIDDKEDGYLAYVARYDYWQYEPISNLLDPIRQDMDELRTELLTKFEEFRKQILNILGKTTYRFEITDEDLAKEYTDYPVAMRIPIRLSDDNLLYNYWSKVKIILVNSVTGDIAFATVTFRQDRYADSYYAVEAGEVILEGSLKDAIRFVGVTNNSYYEAQNLNSPHLYVMVRFNKTGLYEMAVEPISGDKIGSVVKSSSTVTPNGGAGLPIWASKTYLADQDTDYNSYLQGKLVQKYATIDKLTTSGIQIAYDNTSSGTWSIFTQMMNDFYESGEQYILRYDKAYKYLSIGDENGRIIINSKTAKYNGQELYHSGNINTITEPLQEQIDNAESRIDSKITEIDSDFDTLRTDLENDINQSRTDLENLVEEAREENKHRIDSYLIPFGERLTKVEGQLGDIEILLDKILGYEANEYLNETLDEIIG